MHSNTFECSYVATQVPHYDHHLRTGHNIKDENIPLSFVLYLQQGSGLAVYTGPCDNPGKPFVVSARAGELAVGKELRTGGAPFRFVIAVSHTCCAVAQVFRGDTIHGGIGHREDNTRIHGMIYSTSLYQKQTRASKRNQKQYLSVCAPPTHPLLDSPSTATAAAGEANRAGEAIVDGLPVLEPWRRSSKKGTADDDDAGRVSLNTHKMEPVHRSKKRRRETAATPQEPQLHGKNALETRAEFPQWAKAVDTFLELAGMPPP